MSDTTPIIFATAGPVEIQAVAVGERVPRFVISPAYTGGVLRTERFPQGIVVDLAGLTTNVQNVTATLAHDDNRLVGHVDTVRHDGRQLTLGGPISGAGPAATEFQDSYQRGFAWRASIEARPLTAPEFVPAGETVVVNSQSFSGPVLVARRAELYGVSFVPRGADENTSVAIAAQAVDEPPISFEDWYEALGVTADDLSANPDLKARLRAKYDEAMTRRGNEPDDTDTSDSFIDDKEEETMSASSRLLSEACDSIIAEADFTEPSSIKAAEYAKTQCLAGVLTLDKFRGQIIRAAQATRELARIRAERPRGPQITSGAPRGDKTAIQAALFKHLGHETTGEKILGAPAMEAGAALRCTSFMDIIKASLTVAGRDIPASRDDMIRAAFGPSTVDLAGLLGNTANKLLLDAYQAVPSVARMIAKPLTANNFKSHTGYRMVGETKFDQVPRGGEITHGTLAEQSYPYRVDTYARMFGISRQDIIDDDLGAFASVPQIIGRGAAVKLEEVFWTLVLANTSSFFSGGRGNYISGAETALAIAALSAAVTKIRQAVDPNGTPVMVVPKYLVVPPELETTADALYTSTNIALSGTTDVEKPDGNPHKGKYQPLVVPHLSNSSYSGYSATAWYLFGDAADVAAFGIAYLNGIESPTVESENAPFNMLGVQYRGYLDFGVCQIDYRGGVMSAGA